MKLGAHISVQGGVEHAPARAASIGCEALQIFTRNQRQWQAKPLTDSAIAAFHDQMRQFGFAQACVHASYLINLASPKPETLELSLQAMIDEIERAHQLGIPYVIVHSGAHMGEGTERGLERLIASVKTVLHATEHCSGTLLLLENSAGQGTTLGSRLEELQAVQDALAAPERLAFCLDTCHLFAAGYDFTDAESYTRLRDAIAASIGIEAVRVLHFNDSKKPLASRVDKHAAIGQGEIGEAAFGHWVRDAAWEGIFAILETPGGAENYARELRILKAMRRRGDAFPGAEATP